MKSWQREIFCSLSVFVLLGACGGSDGADRISAKWNALCESEIEASNCPDNMDLSGLVEFCKALSPSILDTAECHTQMDAYSACYAQRQWACLEGGELPTVVDPDSCSEEVLAVFTLPSGSCIDQSQVSVSGDIEGS